MAGEEPGTIALTAFLEGGNRTVCIDTGLYAFFDFMESRAALPFDFLWLAVLAGRVRPGGRILEIGTSIGVFASVIARNMADGVAFKTVDLVPAQHDDDTRKNLLFGQGIGDVCRALGLDGRIEFVAVDRGRPLDAYFGADDRFDLVLVDGDHTYEGVRRDSEFSIRHLADGGLILWHDFYPFPSYKAQPHRGVYRYATTDLPGTGLNSAHLAGSALLAGGRALPVPGPSRFDRLKGITLDRNLRVKHLSGLE